VNLPVGILALIVVATRLHLPRHTERKPVDWAGFATLTAAVGCLILMTSWGGSQYAWGSLTIIGLGIARWCSRRRSSGGSVVWRTRSSAAAVLEPGVRHRERDGLHRRPGDVRRR